MIPIGPGQTIVFNDAGKEAITAFLEISHHVLLISPGEEQGCVVIPILHGACVV